MTKMPSVGTTAEYGAGSRSGLASIVVTSRMVNLVLELYWSWNWPQCHRSERLCQVDLVIWRVRRKVSLPWMWIRTFLKWWLPKLTKSRPLLVTEWPRLRRVGIIPRGRVSILRWRRWGPNSRI